jgi:hypothetical protein
MEACVQAVGIGKSVRTDNWIAYLHFGPMPSRSTRHSFIADGIPVVGMRLAKESDKHLQRFCCQ